MKKEYTLLFIAGLFLLAYLLDAVVNPLGVRLPTPYHYFTGEYLYKYPFTTASIVIKAIGLFLTPLWLFSFMGKKYFLKGIILLILAVLMQLYALQDIVTRAAVVPIEWSLSISMAGVALFIPVVLFLFGGIIAKIFGLDKEELDAEEEDDDEGILTGESESETKETQG
ncbi:MAG TPA: hypothetical protein VI819_02365 [Patescibacteria group bacterium]|nr:hypothetical protein [Patescibacteria group bacterium]